MFASSPSAPSAQFGQTVDTPRERAGFVATADIPGLVDKCGCVDEAGRRVEPTSLPFQGFAHVQGDRWMLRIEPLGSHSVNGNFTNAHYWSFSLAAGGDDPNR